MRILWYSLVIFAGLLSSCRQKPVEIYLSKNGHDEASGTQDHPVGTIGRARDLARLHAGKREVHIVFGDGIYYLPQTLVLDADDSGDKHHPVVYRAEHEGQAVISGGLKLQAEWEPYENGIFRAKITDDHVIDQLYVNGRRQRMARFPNPVEGKNVFDTWDLLHTNEPDPDHDPLSRERISRWKHPEGGYIHSMHAYLWGDMHWKIKGVKEDGTLDLEGGWQNNRPTPMHPRYRIVENVFEELDVPGEWYYDSGHKVLYYYPPPGLDLTSATIEIIRLRHLVEFQGSKNDPVRFIVFDGFVFRHAARSFMENREPLLRSDWTVYRGGAMLFNGAEDCTVSNCEFDQVGGNTVFVNNYNRRIAIKSCYIHHSGANGIAFVGDPGTVRSPLFRYGEQDYEKLDRSPGPAGDNYPEDCVVEDCLITMTGRDEKQTAPIQISMSHKIRISHCSIYDVPRAGINISEGTFGGHIIEHCDVFNTVLETGDHGSFNSWGRDRFWTPDINEFSKEVEKDRDLVKLDMLSPNILRNNRWRCDHGWDIDLDDGSSWYYIYDNLLLNGGLKMREGYYRTVTNNIILNNSLHPHVWPPNNGDVFKSNIVFGSYKPAVMEMAIASDGKWGALLDSNLFANGEADLLKFRRNGCDSNSLAGDPLFMDVDNHDFRVVENSPAIRLGFRNFPMNEFGVVSAKLRKIAREPEIPKLISSERSASAGPRFWYSATVKNVETEGEQSAAGLPLKAGIILLSVPEQSVLARHDFRTGDVIMECNGTAVRDLDQLLGILGGNPAGKEYEMTVMRNQQKQKIRLKL